MSRLAAPGLAVVVTTLALLVTGCRGNGRRDAAPNAVTQNSLATCKLTAAQRRTVARARGDIRRLRRIQAPVRTFSQRGAPHQNEVTGQLMLDLGRTTLPPDVFAHLLHLGKTATSLCGDCAQALEADEPFLNNRQASRCG
jgi:hypothetical protein